MKIDVTNAEYRKLLELLMMADWVLFANEVDKEPRREKYRAVIQKFFAFAKEIGCEELIEYDDDLQEYFPTRKFEDTGEHAQFIEEYENELFWDELISRLADRDLLRQAGSLDKLLAMSGEERVEKAGEIEDFYEAEFQTNGLETLNVRPSQLPPSHSLS